MLEKIKELKFNRKMQKQIKKNGYSDDMCWGMDYWILETFPKMILNLRDMKHGYPELPFEEIENFPISWIKEKSQEIDKINIKDGYEKFNIKDGFSRWQLILTRMAWCLQQANEDYTEIYNEYKSSFFEALFNPDSSTKPSEELEKSYFDREAEIREYRNSMKDEAFDLMKKYFWQLWD